MEREGIDVCQKITTVAEYECTYKKKGRRRRWGISSSSYS